MRSRRSGRKIGGVVFWRVGMLSAVFGIFLWHDLGTSSSEFSDAFSLGELCFPSTSLARLDREFDVILLCL